MASLDLSGVRFGATAWSYYDPDPSNIMEFRNAADHIRKLPFPDKEGSERYIEVLHVLPDEKYHNELISNAGEMKKIAEDKNMRVILTGFIPNIPGAASLCSTLVQEKLDAANLIKHRGINAAIHFERDGYSILGGPIHMIHEKFPDKVPRLDEMLVMEKGFVDTVYEGIEPYASKNRVKIAFEPLNRHEMVTVLKPGKIADRLIQQINSPWIGLMADTIHYAQEGGGSYMNCISKAVATGRTFNLHLCEHNRQLFGDGDISYRVRDLFKRVTKALPIGSILYTGPENFAPGLHRNLRIWRPDTETMTLPDIVKSAAYYLSGALSE